MVTSSGVPMGIPGTYIDESGEERQFIDFDPDMRDAMRDVYFEILSDFFSNPSYFKQKNTERCNNNPSAHFDAGCIQIGAAAPMH